MKHFLSGSKSEFIQKHSSGTRVLLCQPWDHFDEGKIDAKKHLKSRWNLPNYGMVLLGTIAQKAGYTVKIFDAESELVMKGEGNPAYILNYRIPLLISCFHPDILGISCISARWPEAYQMAQAFNREREKGSNFKLTTIVRSFYYSFGNK
ncbi:unnamed protein product [marine sediment metagenome]|uniref:B12-binding domain-containing protein n=1 Tax=marine sediment metagenome TaxID=412755 RepID=X1M5I6_9ZZZZ